MHILVLNAGSSSLKYQLIDTAARPEALLARGAAERITDPAEAVAHVLHSVEAIGPIHGIGHRVVHGGARFWQSVLIDDAVEQAIDDCGRLAPLHNPHNLACYRAARRLRPTLPHAAVFDTAFFHSLPARAYLYGIPYEFYQRDHIRRYGFHGTSHRYVSAKACEALRIDPTQARLITCHLGNGCSVAAIAGGKAIDTSFGLTPLEGLLMGTRSGDIDAGVLFHLGRTHGFTLPDLEDLLNRKSGLLGISGRSNDMRDLCEAAAAGDARADLAVEVFCYRVRKYIGAYWAALGGADAIVFTGGIGENRTEVRARIMDGLDCLGAVETLVIPTNEELLIAQDTARLIIGTAGR